MTGKELILYILQNNLENKEVFSDAISNSIFITADQAAVKWGCGSATVKAMIDMKKVKGFIILGQYYTLATEPNPFKYVVEVKGI